MSVSVKVPKLSIIVPIYNAEKYLRKCLDSICSQEYENFEVILVDDGSTDDCSSICNEYVLKYQNINYILINNSGASHARNVGLNKATGEYIWFIDADDFIAVNSISSLLQNFDSDILFFGYHRIFNDDRPPLNCQILESSIKLRVNIVETIIKLFISKEGYFGYTWNKIFRRDIIQKYQIYFSEKLIIKEDEVFTFEYCSHISSLTISSLMPYYYRELPTSVSHNHKRKRHMAELAHYMQTNIALDSYYSSMKSILYNVIHSYLWEAVLEQANHRSVNQAIKTYIEYTNRNKDILSLNLKNKIMTMIPTTALKGIAIKLYLKIYDTIYY